MTNLVEKIKEQAAEYDTLKEQGGVPMCSLDGKPSNYAIKDLLLLQRDTITHIDASQFLGLYATQRASSTMFGKLVADAKKNWPHMAMNAAKSGAKSAGKDIPFVGGLVNAFGVLIEHKFKGKGWGLAGKSLLVDAAKETPFVGDAAGYAVENVIFKKKKNSDENSERKEFDLDFKEVGANAKTEAPKVAKKATMSVLKGFFKEVPVVKGFFNAADVLSENKGKRGLILAGQVFAADLVGTIPKAGKYLKMVVKKVPLVKAGAAGQVQGDADKFVGDDVYYMPERDDKTVVEPLGGEAAQPKDSIALDVAVAPQKTDTIPQAESSLANHVNRLRGRESGVDSCVYKRKRVPVQVNTDSTSVSRLVSLAHGR